MAIEVKVKHDEQLGTYIFTFSFAKWEFKAIKGISAFITGTIPSSARDYDGMTHEWMVLEPFWPPLKDMFEKAQWKVTEEKVVRPEDFFYENQGATIEAPISREELGNQLLAMLGITAEELADHNAAKKAYRKRAFELHPDRPTGDPAKMSELNSIWTQYNSMSVN
jgi:hypothetical protein